MLSLGATGVEWVPKGGGEDWELEGVKENCLVAMACSLGIDSQSKFCRGRLEMHLSEGGLALRMSNRGLERCVRG